MDTPIRKEEFDFDNHEKDTAETDFANEDEMWHDEMDALRLICLQNSIDALVERSCSGKGAHVWIFFQKPIQASLARNLGFLLLDISGGACSSCNCG